MLWPAAAFSTTGGIMLTVSWRARRGAVRARESGRDRDGGGAAHLPRDVAAVGLDLEPGVQRLQRFVAAEGAAIDRELIAEGDGVAGDEGDGLGGGDFPLDDGGTVVVVRARLFARRGGALRLGLPGLAVRDLLPLLHDILHAPERRAPPREFDLHLHLLAHELLQFLQQLPLDRRIQGPVHAKRRREDGAHRRHEAVPLRVFLRVADAGHELPALRVVPGVVQSDQAVVGLELGVGVLDDVVPAAAAVGARFAGFGLRFLGLALAALLYCLLLLPCRRVCPLFCFSLLGFR
jgi:hypothetical protein